MAYQCSVRPRVLILFNQASTDCATIKAHKTCLPVLIRTNQISVENRPRRIHQRRHAHGKRRISTASIDIPDDGRAPEQNNTNIMPSRTALSVLSWPNLLRSYMISSISSVPLILKPSISVMAYLAHSKSRLLNPDHNRLLHALLKKTFYVQFCAGENAAETRRTIKQLKEIGYKGVILGHAREVVLSKEEAASLGTVQESTEADLKEVKRWQDDTLNTVMLTERGDYVALKFTGSGKQALQYLKSTIPCAPHLRDAVHQVCKLAKERGVSLLFDAEQAALQEGIDNWTMYYMKHYNKERAVVYGTYQAYAKKTPGVLAQHLATAQREGYVLGVKLVRGAYLGSDPRELFWDTVEDTHKCYDNIAKCVMERRYEGLLQPAKGASAEFPEVELILASHNMESVRKARALRDEQARSGQPRIRMAYGQLMGMADHLSCELVQQTNSKKDIVAQTVDVPEAFKYLVWGTMRECMKYLLRRARENQDAVARTADARRALGKEIAIRLGLART